MHDDAYANLRGDRNPMRRPEVAAKQSASLRAFYARTNKKPKPIVWTPELRAKQAERARKMWAEGAGKGAPWSDERRKQHGEKMKAYWARVHAALKAMGESQHDPNSAT